MTSVDFERFLSAYPSVDAPCVRDLIFDYYCRKHPNDVELPARKMKAYTDALHDRLVRTPQETVGDKL
jgi:hypothetical protein